MFKINNIKKYALTVMLAVGAMFAFQPDANAGGIKFHKGYVPVPVMHIDICRNPSVCVHVDCIDCFDCDLRGYPYHAPGYRHNHRPVPPPRYHHPAPPPPKYRHPAPPPRRVAPPPAHRPAPKPAPHAGKPAPHKR